MVIGIYISNSVLGLGWAANDRKPQITVKKRN